MAVYRPTYTDPKTGKKKQQEIWWVEFTFGGRRIRESSKSTRKTIALEFEKNRRLQLERANAGIVAQEVPALRLRRVKDALTDYGKMYPITHRPKSVATLKERSAPLVRLLGALMPSDLTQDRMLRYVADRKKEGAGNRTINLEVGILARALEMKPQALWPKLKRLEENHDVGRSLEPDEERRLFVSAAKSPSMLVYAFLRLLLWTGMRSTEARTLRWAQVNIDAGEIIVGRSKTAAGQGRRIPMSENLKAVMDQHKAYCQSVFGTLQPDWYVFPRGKGCAPTDPTKPIGSFQTAWETIRKNAKVSCRIHDLRHHFCSTLAESGIPEHVMVDLMGHLSPGMLRRYSHVRAAARRQAIDMIEARYNATLEPKESPKVS
jgi:integrase